MSDARQTIVVVDDDLGMNQAMERLFKAAGFAVATFQNGHELLEWPCADKAECFILDVHLPRLSGFELQELLRKRGHLAPVIFITAFDDPETRQRAQRSQAAAYFVKPFQGYTLLTAVARSVRAEAPGVRAASEP